MSQHNESPVVQFNLVCSCCCTTKWPFKGMKHVGVTYSVKVVIE